MAGQQQQQQQNDNSMGPIWIIMLLMIAGYLIWYFAHAQIVKFVFFITLLQAKTIAFALGHNILSQQIYYLQYADVNSVSWQDMADTLYAVGFYVRYPYIVILCLLALYLYKSNIILKYKKVHDMRSLRSQEQYNWSGIMPVTKLDLVSQDINQGPWAMAMNPMDFCRKHDLLRKEDLLLDNQVPGMELTAGIRKSDAKRIFTIQLGPYWEGFDKMPPHTQALAAVFMARLNRDRGGATDIISLLNKQSQLGKMDFSVAKALLQKHQNSPLVQEIVVGHAYMLTVMISILAKSRDDGVLATSDFLWLKPLDRRLWYVLNCVGRQTPFAEVGGVFAHWRAEKALGRKSLMPMIDEAIKALEVAVKEVRLKPKELRGLQP
jgi:intracellular multiplication protein IcmP